MNVELKKIKRTVYIVVAILVVAMAVLSWFLTRALVTITISPRTSKVWLDNKEISVIAGEANINTTTGSHLLRIEADSYTGQSQNLDLGRGFNKKIDITLTQTPNPVEINSDSTLLAKGTNFNDGYYLSKNIIYRMKIGLDDQGVVSVLENHPITQPKINDVREIIWSPSKELALLRHTSSITLFDFMKYDFVNQTDSPWGGNDIGSISWAPDNSRITYFYAPASGEKTLIFANITNTATERVLNFKDYGIENPIIKWSPDSRYLIVIPRNSDASRNKIYLFDSYSRSLKVLVDDGNQVDASFSPDNNKVLYSTRNSDGTTSLSIVNKDGGNKKSLNLVADMNTLTWTNDSKNLIVADSKDGSSSIFEYSVESMTPLGFEINNIPAAIKAVTITDDGKLAIYQTDNKIYALRVN